MSRQLAVRRHQLALVRRVNRLTDRWSYDCHYHGWGMWQLVHKACKEIGITDADYYTWRDCR